MKRFFNYFLAIFVSTTLFFTACSEDETIKVNDQAFASVKDYLATNNMDLDKILSSNVITVPAAVDAVPAFVTTYYILDIRPAADFANGHIENAKNCALADVVTKVKADAPTKPVLIVDADGQTAPYAVVALRLSGYPTAAILKWGMSSWNTTLNVWDSKTGNVGASSTNWTKTTPSDPGTYAYPKINTTATEVNKILEERITALLKDGPQTVVNSTVLTNPSAYYINNYWTAELVTKHGLIKGAFRISPLTTGNLNTLDPSKPVVTYCFTGQTSAFIAAWLKVLGYDAKFIPFGNNSMIYDDMKTQGTANTWIAATQSKNYPLVK